MVVDNYIIYYVIDLEVVTLVNVNVLCGASNIHKRL